MRYLSDDDDRLPSRQVRIRVGPPVNAESFYRRLVLVRSFTVLVRPRVQIFMLLCWRYSSDSTLESRRVFPRLEVVEIRVALVVCHLRTAVALSSSKTSTKRSRYAYDDLCGCDYGLTIRKRYILRIDRRSSLSYRDLDFDWHVMSRFLLYSTNAPWHMLRPVKTELLR